jgi:large repetitive protein
MAAMKRFVSALTTNPGYRRGALLQQLPAPVVLSVSPASGQYEAAELVSISGKHFTAGAKVFFGEAEGLQVNVVSSTQVSARAPVGVPDTHVDLRVTNPDGQTGTLENGWHYEPVPGPVITGISPSTVGAHGGPVVIDGEHLHLEAVVTVDGTPVGAQYHLGQIIAQAPPNDPGTVTLRVTNPDGQWSETMLTYSGLFIAEITPNTGPAEGGTEVTISGGGFVDDMMVLLLSDTEDIGFLEDVVFVDGGTITGTVPALPPGSYHVVVGYDPNPYEELLYAFTVT